jgi:hypothetical protein
VIEACGQKTRPRFRGELGMVQKLSLPFNPSGLIGPTGLASVWGVHGEFLTRPEILVKCVRVRTAATYLSTCPGRINCDRPVWGL